MFKSSNEIKSGTFLVPLDVWFNSKIDTWQHVTVFTHQKRNYIQNINIHLFANSNFFLCDTYLRLYSKMYVNACWAGKQATTALLRHLSLFNGVVSILPQYQKVKCCHCNDSFFSTCLYSEVVCSKYAKMLVIRSPEVAGTNKIWWP